MKLAIDVDYQKEKATVAGVLFKHWQSSQPAREIISKVSPVNEYIPGEFYKRELPCLLKLLTEHNIDPECILIDGYVYLDGNTKPGLGKYLFDELNSKIPVIGIAKNPYKDISSEYKIYRGKSKNPIYITSAGLSLKAAQEHIRKMYGKYRIPDLLKKADQICRNN